MSMLNDIYIHLEANNLATNVYKGRLPDKPDNIAALFGYAGRGPIYYYDTDADPVNPPLKSRERPGLQVQSRALQDATAESRAYELASFLELIVNQTINGVWYVRVEMLSSPYQLRHDQNDRSIWAANFLVEKEKA